MTVSANSALGLKTASDAKSTYYRSDRIAPHRSSDFKLSTTNRLLGADTPNTHLRMIKIVSNR